ncbi:MAG: hypothetical protein HGA38_03150 [Candidatus Moranbacteria bacterium]|nr:hypothetical protein [Candidatus Moranbacteria bacterium]
MEKRKALEEEIRKAVCPITVHRSRQDFISFWDEERAIIRRTVIAMREFGVTRKAEVIAVACRMLLDRIEGIDQKYAEKK